MPITFEIFKDHFSGLCGAYDRPMKQNTADAWYDEMAEWDYNLFAEVIKRLKDRDSFPVLKHARAMKRMIAGDPKPRKVEEDLKGCLKCDGGLIYYHKVAEDGSIASQGFVGRCSECAHPELARYRDVSPMWLKTAKGWDYDWPHYLRWKMIKEGKDPDESVGVGSDAVRKLAPFGLADPATEKERGLELWKEEQRRKREQEEEEERKEAFAE